MGEEQERMVKNGDFLVMPGMLQKLYSHVKIQFLEGSFEEILRPPCLGLAERAV